MRLVNQAKTEEQKYIEKMKVLEVVERKEASGSKVIRTKWAVRETKRPGSMGCTVSITLQLVYRNWWRVYSVTPRVLEGTRITLWHVRRAYFYAEPLPKTFVELPDYYDLDTWTRCCGRLRRCWYGTRQAARSWQREKERGIKTAGIVMGKMSKCSLKSPCGKLVGVVHGDDTLLAGPRSLVDAARKSLREQMMGVQLMRVETSC